MGAHADITALLRRAGEGDAEAMAELTPVVYEELRSLAHRALRNRSPGQTLRTTALVNEAYLKLVDQTSGGYDSPGRAQGQRGRIAIHRRQPCMGSSETRQRGNLTTNPRFLRPAHRPAGK